MTANMSDESEGRPKVVVPTGRLEDLSTSRNRAWTEVAKLESEVARLSAEIDRARAVIIRLQRKAWPDKFPDEHPTEPTGEPDFLVDSDGVRWTRVGPDLYQSSEWPDFCPDREKLERSAGPLSEGWK